MANLQIGTIGLGRLGYHHTKNVTRTFGAELVAVADAFPDALKRGETDFGVKGYADYRDLINDPEVEAIVIATPTQTHYESQQKRQDYQYRLHFRLRCLCGSIHLLRRQGRCGQYDA